MTATDDFAPDDKKLWAIVLPRIKKNIAMLVENEAFRKLVAARQDLNLKLLGMLETKSSAYQRDDREGRTRSAKRRRTDGSI